MNYDPYNGKQTRFQRSDPTGRWIPIHEHIPDEPGWFAVLGGLVTGVLIALGLWLGL